MVARSPRLLQELSKIDPTAFVFTPTALNQPAVKITGGTFFRNYGVANTTPRPLYKDLRLTIGSPVSERWAVVGPAGAGKTTFLELLRGRHSCDPTAARKYPALEELIKQRSLPLDPSTLIEYIGPARRDGALAGSAAQGAYLSARYESGREASDLTLQDYLTGNMQLNPDSSQRAQIREIAESPFYGQVLQELELTRLANQPLSTLSNGQTRRARIARALVLRPGMLLIDEPFVGLDPVAQRMLAQLFRNLSTKYFLPLICTFEDAETLPTFITHVLFINAQHQILASGSRKEVRVQLQDTEYQLQSSTRPKPKSSAPEEDVPAEDDGNSTSPWFKQGTAPAACSKDNASGQTPPPVIEMDGVRVRYGDITALGAWQQQIDGDQRPGLWWKALQGERWGIFGANGAGKTTLLSLINSDHPQAYSEPIRLFRQARLPTAGQPGLSIFDLQARIGQASPEIHNFFPRHLTVRQTLESAWAETFRAPPRLTHENDRAVEATLRWFQPQLDPNVNANDLSPVLMERRAREPRWPLIADYLASDVDWADHVTFRDLDFNAQRVALFLRAIIRKPDLVVLDEAFGGMSSPARIRCMSWLAYGERQRIEFPLPGRTGTGMPRRRLSPLAHPHRSASGRGITPLTVDGLEPRQTLLCVAHRKEDVPPILNRWMVLPPDGGRAGYGDGAVGVPPRFGSFTFPGTEWRTGTWWNEMWEVPGRCSGQRPLPVH